MNPPANVRDALTILTALLVVAWIVPAGVAGLPYRSYRETSPLEPSKVVTLGPLLRPSEICCAVTKGNTAPRRLFGEGPATPKGTGEHKRIHGRWFGVLAPRGVSPSTVAKYVVLAVVPLLLLLVLFVAWSRTLRRQVAQRTRELRESEERLSGFFRDSHVGLAMWDRDFRYILINDALQKINGPSREEHIGRTVEEVLPDAAHIIMPLFAKVLSAGKPILGMELCGEVPSRPGEITHYQVSYFPIPGAGGEPQFIGGVVIDVTDHKRVEHELERHRDHLEERVRDRTDELRSMVISMAGRENRMAELKEAIRKLRAQIEEAGMTPVADDPLTSEPDFSPGHGSMETEDGTST